jgi:hypothetical protein
MRCLWPPLNWCGYRWPPSLASPTV